MKPLLNLVWILVLGWAPIVVAQEQGTGTLTPVEYVAEDLRGTVSVREAGASEWVAAQEGQALESGDEIKTGEEGQASLSLGSDTTLFLGPGTSLTVTEISDNGQGGFISRLKLLAGRLLSDVKKDLTASRSNFEVESGGVVCGVRGTAFEITAGADQTDLGVHEGGVQVSEEGTARLVKAGYTAGFKKGRFLLQRRLERRESSRFQEWRKFRKTVLLKRFHRLEEIRKNIRKPWKRKHPRLKKALLRKAFQQNRHP